MATLNPELILGKIIIAHTAQGLLHAVGQCVGHSGAPVFYFTNDSGERVSWRDDMCTQADAAEELKYWQARAENAEQKLRGAL